MSALRSVWVAEDEQARWHEEIVRSDDPSVSRDDPSVRRDGWTVPPDVRIVATTIGDVTAHDPVVAENDWIAWHDDDARAEQRAMGRRHRARTLSKPSPR